MAEQPDTAQLFLDYLKNPFQKSFNESAILSSLGTSLGVSAAIFLIFCFIRPHNSIVYAPKLRTSNGKNAPPKLPKGIFSWFKPMIDLSEEQLLDIIGLDALVFLRFLRMCRNIFGILGLLSTAVIIPVNVVAAKKWAKDTHNTDLLKNPLALMTTQVVWGDSMWAHVVAAYVFCFIVLYFLWSNYKAITELKQKYFRSEAYQNAIASRSLMISDVPKNRQSDLGLARIIGDARVPGNGDEICAIGRNLKGLPDLIEKHEFAVRKLEGILAKYLKNPDRLPPRPMCKPEKDDAYIKPGTRVDAITYWNDRVKRLEKEIEALRNSIDERSATHYGFVSYPTIAQAHRVAKATYHKKINGAEITPAPSPLDIIWKNLGTSRAKRRSNAIIGGVLYVALSVFYIVPNALMAAFLSDISRIGALWRDFSVVVNRYPKLFGFVQGVAVPVITSIIYLVLPMIMRRIAAWQGELTKTRREMNVTTKLYFFFVFNNLIIFTLFSTIWQMISHVVTATSTGGDFWAAVEAFQFGYKATGAIVEVSRFWIMYLLQRNLGAVLDLAQLVSLFWGSFSRKFLSPTPREIIEKSAPPTFEYASYYNYFLFYSTIALLFATLQPVILLVAFLYFLVDSWLRKYQLIYIFTTKVESGGAYWRLLFNRFLVALVFSQLILGIVIYQQGGPRRAYSIIPIAFILIGFKIYCRVKFDAKIKYYIDDLERSGSGAPELGNIAQQQHRLEKRFGHPALTKKLPKPMVHAKAQHILPSLGLDVGDDEYRDKGGDIPLDDMQGGQRGRAAVKSGMYQVVNESQLDFTQWMHRSEFAEAAQTSTNGGSTLYDHDGMSIRSGMNTPAPGSPGPYGRNSRPVSRVGSPAGQPRLHLPQSLLVGGAQYQPLQDQASPAASPYLAPTPGSADWHPGYAESTGSRPSFDPMNAAARDAYAQNLSGAPGGGYGGFSPAPQGGMSYEEYRKGYR